MKLECKGWEFLEFLTEMDCNKCPLFLACIIFPSTCSWEDVVRQVEIRGLCERFRVKVSRSVFLQRKRNERCSQRMKDRVKEFS